MAKPKNKKKKKTFRLTSSLRQHSQVGKTLVPPMLTVPGLAFQSWTNDRLPEMLWACLVASVLPRDDALAAFREIAAIGLRYRDTEGTGTWSLFHSQLPQLPAEILLHIAHVITKHPLGYAALRPLLLFDGLPGRSMWENILTVQTQDGDWQTLGSAVVKTLDHQSQESTDVRWLSILFKMALGVIHFPVQLKERAEELVEYPNKGDMRAVRPFVRSSEMTFSMHLPQGNEWSQCFWKECLEKTACNPSTLLRKTGGGYDRIAAIEKIQQVHKDLQAHWFHTLDTTAVDPRHDGALGFGFYSLALLLEMVVGRNGFGITGRALLRSLVECRITLAYLRHAGSDELWKKFRSFGTGQAKLAFLKLDEVDARKPDFVSSEILEQLSNEDFYQEYVKIDLGHWCGLDLRKMAEVSAVKDDYDLVYGWASTFVHGHWPAIRDSCMTHCFNPLHRLHRIPLPGHRLLEDAVPDGVRLVNKVLEDIAAFYPDFPERIALVAKSKAGGQRGPTT